MALTDNKNFLSPVGVRFVLHRAPNLEYFVQDITLPEISIQDLMQPTPRTSIPRAGVKLEYAPLIMSFILDEDMNDYLEIHNWLYGLGAPETHQQYANLANSQDGIVSDGTVLILTSNNNANKRIFFRNLFPISLSPLDFTVSDTEINYLKAQVTFRYTTFEIE